LQHDGGGAKYVSYLQEETSSNEHNAQIRSKLPTFHNPLKRFMKSKSERESDSEARNVNYCEIRPHVLEKIDELVNVDSGKKISRLISTKKNIYLFQIFSKGVYILEYYIKNIPFTFSLRQHPRWMNKIRKRAIPRIISSSIILWMLQGRANLTKTSPVICPKSTPLNPRPPLRTLSSSPRVPSIVILRERNRVRPYRIQLLMPVYL